ncbi:MAG: hypothetical protein O7B26_11695 [Planctomycetota bacterium]|nr:hypothetical protein [Planctomycetota bacterium]
MESEPQDADALRRKMEILESENARLKKRVESVFGPDNPNFDPQAFMKAMRRYMGFIWLSFALAMLFLVLATSGTISVPNIPVGPTVLFDPGGMYSGMPGVGRGIIAGGGLAIGVIAVGGLAIGVVAIGGGAVGIFAFGGGAIGIVAVGGGAFGLIAMGGGGFGRYVLAGNGAGTFVFSLKRQDRAAIEFFTRYLPRFRHAITNPMPVIPVQSFDEMR